MNFTIYATNENWGKYEQLLRERERRRRCVHVAPAHGAGRGDLRPAPVDRPRHTSPRHAVRPPATATSTSRSRRSQHLRYRWCWRFRRSSHASHSSVSAPSAPPHSLRALYYNVIKHADFHIRVASSVRELCSRRENYKNHHISGSHFTIRIVFKKPPLYG
jgi:hypothetical protein